VRGRAEHNVDRKVFQKGTDVDESVIGVTPSKTFTNGFGQEVVNLTITISVCGQEGRDGAQVEDVKALGLGGEVHLVFLSSWDDLTLSDSSAGVNDLLRGGVGTDCARDSSFGLGF